MLSAYRSKRRAGGHLRPSFPASPRPDTVPVADLVALDRRPPVRSAAMRSESMEPMGSNRMWPKQMRSDSMRPDPSPSKPMRPASMRPTPMPRKPKPMATRPDPNPRQPSVETSRMSFDRDDLSQGNEYLRPPSRKSRPSSRKSQLDDKVDFARKGRSPKKERADWSTAPPGDSRRDVDPNRGKRSPPKRTVEEDSFEPAAVPSARKFAVANRERGSREIPVALEPKEALPEPILSTKKRVARNVPREMPVTPGPILSARKRAPRPDAHELPVAQKAAPGPTSSAQKRLRPRGKRPSGRIFAQLHEVAINVVPLDGAGPVKGVRRGLLPDCVREHDTQTRVAASSADGDADDALEADARLQSAHAQFVLAVLDAAERAARVMPKESADELMLGLPRLVLAVVRRGWSQAAVTALDRIASSRDILMPALLRNTDADTLLLIVASFAQFEPSVSLQLLRRVAPGVEGTPRVSPLPEATIKSVLLAATADESLLKDVDAILQLMRTGPVDVAVTANFSWRYPKATPALWWEAVSVRAAVSGYLAALEFARNHGLLVPVTDKEADSARLENAEAAFSALLPFAPDDSAEKLAAEVLGVSEVDMSRSGSVISAVILGRAQRGSNEPSAYLRQLSMAIVDSPPAIMRHVLEYFLIICIDRSDSQTALRVAAMLERSVFQKDLEVGSDIMSPELMSQLVGFLVRSNRVMPALRLLRRQLPRSEKPYAAIRTALRDADFLEKEFKAQTRKSISSIQHEAATNVKDNAVVVPPPPPA